MSRTVYPPRLRTLVLLVMGTKRARRQFNPPDGEDEGKGGISSLTWTYRNQRHLTWEPPNLGLP